MKKDEGENSDGAAWTTYASQLELAYTRGAENFQPWIERSDFVRTEQKIFQEILTRRAGARFLGANRFVSTLAQIHTNSFSLGDNSWIAAGAIVRGYVTIGSNSTVNPYAHIAGKIEIGDGVRIAGSASIYGFNHGFDRTDVWIFQQAHTSKGIVIGDGTWVGANTVITDGINIGKHCVVAAGAVVTKDVPEYSIVGGNPARVIRSRKTGASDADSG